MDVLKKVTAGCKQLTEVALAILALAVVLQVLFGQGVAFFPVDVIGNVVTVTKSLGSEGLVGLVAIWILYSIFDRKAE